MHNSLKIVLGFVCLFITNNLFAQTEEDVNNYIDKYKRLAIEEQIRSGVPAAITLAQGIHEATWRAHGRLPLPERQVHHFWR